jgi:hypothetical protein
MSSTKYNRTYHFPFSEGATNDDKIQHDWQGILSHEIVITEKLDGENTCLKANGVYARSHAAPTQSPWSKNMQQIWVQVHNDLGNLEIFGENLYGIHSIEYERLPAYFFIFAIRDEGYWLSWDEVIFYAKLLDLPTVPVVARDYFTETTLKQHIAGNIATGSAFGSHCEGYVCRTAKGFENELFPYHVLKYVRANHVQTDQHWTRNWQRATLHNPPIV